MRALVQRVLSASVTVVTRGRSDNEGGPDVAAHREAARCDEVGRIGPGLCVLIGVTHADTAAHARKLAHKIWNLRIIDDDAGVMNRSVADTSREVLIVSQFTLYGDTRAGRRPSWIAAARPAHAEPLVDAVATHLRSLGATVATGLFRTDMAVSIVNDGPVTVMLEIP